MFKSINAVSIPVVLGTPASPWLSAHCAIVQPKVNQVGESWIMLDCACYLTISMLEPNLYANQILYTIHTWMNSFVICCIRQINNKPIKYLKEKNAAQAPVNSFSKSLYALPSVFWNHLPPVRLKKGYLSGVWATGGQPLRGFWRKVDMEYLVFAPHNFQLVPENQDMACCQSLQEYELW